jgi:hypothetical protein
MDSGPAIRTSPHKRRLFTPTSHQRLQSRQLLTPSTDSLQSSFLQSGSQVTLQPVVSRHRINTSFTLRHNHSLPGSLSPRHTTRLAVTVLMLSMVTASLPQHLQRTVKQTGQPAHLSSQLFKLKRHRKPTQ